MHYRNFGNTDLRVSEIGFGAWAIGGPAEAGGMPIGWSNTDDATSIAALERALDLGINFYDTADFYGLGHSEALIGRVFGNRPDVIIATKVGQRLDEQGGIAVDYRKDYILRACEESLRRLRRDQIDFYQLHIARMVHLQDGACIETMEALRDSGKIRYWGLSVNTYTPDPEGDFLIERSLGHGFQLVLNVLNQRAVPLLRRAGAAGYGIIVRMPLQFGLLTGKFNRHTTFPPDDHRSFRLTPAVLAAALPALAPLRELAERYGVSQTDIALAFILSFPEISTVIPGIRTPGQAERNSSLPVRLTEADRDYLLSLNADHFAPVLALMQTVG